MRGGAEIFRGGAHYLTSMTLYRRSTAQVATTIADPVERLRFLRARAASRARRRRFARRWFLLLALVSITAATLVPKAAPSRPTAVVAAPMPILRIADTRNVPNVWMVEKTADSETWSNGLRIDNHFLVTTHPRSYLAFPADGSAPVHRIAPVGIVFHTTESSQAPFEESENQMLKKIGESLLEYVRRREAYNFVVDRFGRVFRVVPEEHAANHAGYSAWANANSFYINLNDSFLGVSFEAASPGGLAPAQVSSARVLIEMLRSPVRHPRIELHHACAGVGESFEHACWPACRLGRRLSFRSRGSYGQLQSSIASCVGARIRLRCPLQRQGRRTTARRD